MHDAERAIAGFEVAQDDAEAENIGQLLEADRLALHFGPDRKWLLAPAINMRGQAVLLEILGKLAFDLADQIAVALGKRIQPLPDHRIGVRIERTERKILELLPHLLHAHAPRQRGIDVERLL